MRRAATVITGVVLVLSGLELGRRIHQQYEGEHASRCEFSVFPAFELDISGFKDYHYLISDKDGIESVLCVDSEKNVIHHVSKPLFPGDPGSAHDPPSMLPSSSHPREEFLNYDGEKMTDMRGYLEAESLSEIRVTDLKGNVTSFRPQPF